MTFLDLLNELTEAARNNHDKGTQFEKLFANYLLTDPQYSTHIPARLTSMEQTRFHTSPKFSGSFLELIGVTEKVSTETDDRIAKLLSKNPTLPVEYTVTTSGKW